MKIHFEGTRKELYRQLCTYYYNLDWKVLKLGKIRPITGVKSCYSFDIAVESRIPYKDDEYFGEDLIRDSISDQLYGYCVPSPSVEAYEDAFKSLSSYIENEKCINLEDIMNKLKECKKIIFDNNKDIEYYETHRLARKF